MRKSQSASVSSSKRKNVNLLGVRTRKKHKRLDAICEDDYKRNHRVKLEANKGSGRGGHLENDSEVRKSSRVRRAPVILDSSPVPTRKRRKIDETRKKFGDSGKKLKGKDKVETEGCPSSSGNSDEELGAWRLRLRSRGKSGSLKLLGVRIRHVGKIKLVLDDEGEMDLAKDEPENELQCFNSDKSRVLKYVDDDSGRALADSEDELHDGCLVDVELENGVHFWRLLG